MSNLQADLNILGYTQTWLDYGVLPDEQLQIQLTEFAGGADPHPEHYRYRTISSYINTRMLKKKRRGQQFSKADD